MQLVQDCHRWERRGPSVSSIFLLSSSFGGAVVAVFRVAEAIEPAKVLVSIECKAFGRHKSCKKVQNQPRIEHWPPERHLKASPTSSPTVRNQTSKRRAQKMIRPANLVCYSAAPFRVLAISFQLIQPRAWCSWHCVWRSLDLSTVSSYAVRSVTTRPTCPWLYYLTRLGMGISARL